MLEILDVSGALVSIDAAGCQKEIAAQIVAKKGDYLLQVKGNQGRLNRDIQKLTAQELEIDLSLQNYAEQPPEKQTHGRTEFRSCLVIDDVEKLKNQIRDFELWKGLKSVIVITSVREMEGKVSEEVRYYISSRSGSAAEFLKSVRRHWSIENQCHWVLDVAFREDDHRLRDGHAPENLSTIRRMASIMLKRVNHKRGIKNKRRKAGWDNRFLELIFKEFLEI